jgi:hypothetical protein
MRNAAGEAIKLGDDNHVPLAGEVQGLLESQSQTYRRCPLSEDLFAAERV